ncbi:MAG: tRNA (adenosine(37)-N6)-dimethylallyltransferase MiaA [Candidatus Paraprevotella stercoravium]|uniref:tRNA dimethylallyltransferase n=2 Tax=Bacteroidales TaxID=171549 RepID=A0ABT7U2R9_9BACE|nr:tRNA (adenosine(37)-N6)-dimethylallyltransferase MiaA [Candidatus Paraprevotella stercoravium]MDM8144824.1 tRNA (adenosine(37)-N6)-dimethylallyltransferase MiaA [Bacteroides eggerthii]
MMKYDMITILGPTASGKTTLAAHLAASLQGEIISADSRQVYRRMDLGTGKDLDDYRIDGVQVPYHLIDICEPGTQYNVYEYQKDFKKVWRELQERQVLPVLCGGTGLYLESVLRGYRMDTVPENTPLRESLAGKSLEELTALLSTYKTLHNKTDVDSVKRAIRAIEIAEYYRTHPVDQTEMPPLNSLVIGIDIPRELRRSRISARLKQRLDEGMIDEVRSLLAEGIPADNLIYYGLEYKFLTLHVLGQLSYEEMYHQLEIAIHQFAKRQMTWFRGMERRGVCIHWIDGTQPLEEKVRQIVECYRLP